MYNEYKRMCVCVCVCIYIYIYIYICSFIHTYAQIYMYAYIKFKSIYLISYSFFSLLANSTDDDFGVNEMIVTTHLSVVTFRETTTLGWLDTFVITEIRRECDTLHEVK